MNSGTLFFSLSGTHTCSSALVHIQSHSQRLLALFISSGRGEWDHSVPEVAMATAVGCTCAESAQLGVSPCVLFRHRLTGHNTLKCNYISKTEKQNSHGEYKKGTERTDGIYFRDRPYEILHLATTPKVLHNHSWAKAELRSHLQANYSEQKVNIK